MVIFHLFGEKPPLYRLKPKFASLGNLADLITCAKFQDEMFRVTILQGGGDEFSIFLLIFAWALQQQCYCAACDKPTERRRTLFAYVTVESCYVHVLETVAVKLGKRTAKNLAELLTIQKPQN